MKFPNAIVSFIFLFFLFACKSTNNTNLATKTTASKKNEKEVAIDDFRKFYSKHPYRKFKVKVEKSVNEIKQLLQDDGKFSDLIKDQEDIESKKLYLKKGGKYQNPVSELNNLGLDRLWVLAETYRNKSNATILEDKTVQKIMRGFINYGELELKRANVSNGRFHASCFAIPLAAVNTYFIFLEHMDAVESGKNTTELVVKFNDILKKVGMQSWTQPFRNDETDNNVVQVDRFRNHVWWVGGNGLTFRPVLQTAFMMKSTKMVDVLAEVSSKALSNVSQNTYNEAFWIEGFTADGSGWGHGKQNLIWGYPILGTSSALESLNMLKGSPWDKKLSKENIDALFNGLRGSSWFYFKGHELPGLDRTYMLYKPEKRVPTSKSIINNLQKKWTNSLNSAELKELNLLSEEIKNYKISMSYMPSGYYTGTRWFFNNDNFAKKNDDYHVYISMASDRVSGIETSISNANNRAFYTCDGMTLYQRQGNEYNTAFGGYNLTAIPGVTNRQGEDKLIPETNWNGYVSKYNFAAGATSGAENGATGFIYEKQNKTNTNKANDNIKNGLSEIIYGVKAYKSYFLINDYVVALGAGITNKNADKEGDVWTTVEQTLHQNNITWKSSEKQGEIQKNEDKIVVLYNSEDKNKDLVWANQTNGFAYAVIPEQTNGKVTISSENRTTKWDLINASNKKVKNKPKSVPIFQMWIDHSKEITDGKYGYITYTGKDFNENIFRENPIKVMQNDTRIQAAASKNETILGALFFDENAVLESNKGTIKVSHQSAVLLEYTANTCKISVSDAKMDKNLKEIIITTTIPFKGKEVLKNGDVYEITIPMPQGKLCGKPSIVILEI